MSLVHRLSPRQVEAIEARRGGRLSARRLSPNIGKRSGILLLFLAVSTALWLCSSVARAEGEVDDLSLNPKSSCDDYFPKYDHLVHHGSTEPDSEALDGEMSPLEMAEFYLPMVLEVCSKHRGLNALLVETKVALGNNRGALAVIGNVLEWAPNDVELLRLGAQLHGMMGDYQPSLDMIARAQAAAPRDRSLLSDQCALLNVGKHYQEAVSYCSTLIESKPSDLATLLFIRGKSYEALGDAAKAKLDLEQAKGLGFDVR